jgi:hypothetical protein
MLFHEPILVEDDIVNIIAPLRLPASARVVAAFRGMARRGVVVYGAYDMRHSKAPIPKRSASGRNR